MADPKYLSTDPSAGTPVSAKAKPEQPAPEGTKGGLVLEGIAKAAPIVENAAMNFATNPNVPKAAAKIGRVVGAVAPPVVGAVKGGPVGFLAGTAASAKGAWAGGKTGWFTGKMLQNMSAPAAKVLEAVEPYAPYLSAIAGAQGVLDLAQMVDPKRKDIGVMGMSLSNQRTDAEKKEHPAMLNQIFTALVDKGLTTGQAISAMMFAAKHGPK